MTYTITKHAKERYAERIMGKTDLDVVRFALVNDEKITEDINKMIEYGECLYVDKDRKSVYIKGCWIIICDDVKQNVVTLYKVDLGLGDEFNKQYLNLIIEKLNTSKEELEKTKLDLEELNENYQNIISENDAMVAEYQSTINNLNQLSEDYRSVIQHNQVLIDAKEIETKDILNKLIGKKVL